MKTLNLINSKSLLTVKILREFSTNPLTDWIRALYNRWDPRQHFCKGSAKNRDLTNENHPCEPVLRSTSVRALDRMKSIDSYLLSSNKNSLTKWKEVKYRS